MKKKADFLELFAVEKPIIGMVHLEGKTDQEIQERAKKEIQIYSEHGVDAILMKNYYGNYIQLEKALQYITSLDLPIPIGVNVLNVDPLGFHSANRYYLRLLQVDSVVGHVRPQGETFLRAFFDLYRVKTTAKLIDGMRFKYQPMLSRKSVEENSKVAQRRCDAIAATENATGEEAPLEKIELFGKQLPEFLSVVATGLSDKSAKEQLTICDTAVVGNNSKDTRKDTGDVYAPYVGSLMKIMKELRDE